MPYTGVRVDGLSQAGEARAAGSLWLHQIGGDVRKLDFGSWEGDSWKVG